MSRIVIAAFAVVLSHFALACAAEIEPTASQDADNAETSAPAVNGELILLPPNREKAIADHEASAPSAASRIGGNNVNEYAIARPKIATVMLYKPEPKVDKVLVERE